MDTYLTFEKPIAEIEDKIRELRHVADGGGVNIVDEITHLQAKVDRLLQQTYTRLTPWQRTQVARHPDRPHFGDYVAALVSDFTPLAGDRKFGDDAAIVGGLGRFRGYTAMVIGHEKGADTEGRVHHNFGMARPEGYRKAMRLMHMAERFGAPVVTLIDTPGAYPGLGAEERGQAEAIAHNLEEMAALRIPFIAVVIGEGGSGGALALGVADRLLMLENSIYSVISPEGCAAILWNDAGQKERAAEALKLTARDLYDLGMIDQIIPEPPGGAHTDPDGAAAALGTALETHLADLAALQPDERIQQRADKYRKIGQFTEG